MSKDITKDTDTERSPQHIDLPIQARVHFSNDIDKIDLNKTIKHVSIPLLRDGGVGGFFWSAQVDRFVDMVSPLIYV